MYITVLIVYGVLMLVILVFSITQLVLTIKYHVARKASPQPGGQPGYVPFVTVQLPVYNEMYVIERLIKAVSNFTYPLDKFEIQVLDDSTDETSEKIRNMLPGLKEKGISIHHIQRENRVGFKAGALEEGLNTARGELVAIFDADFLPEPDFLEKAVPYFKNEKTGVVQARWSHLNKNYNHLTRVQAFGLDAHFTVEQRGRNSSGFFINFNGTAGVWRRKCIEQAGGWQHDTLTEDLDLSYRAQMKGWEFVYLEELKARAELPVAMSAIKNQQFRWTKGGAENFRKNLWPLLRSKSAGAWQKVFGFFHLFSSSIFVCILFSTLLSVPVLIIKAHSPRYDVLYNLSSVFLVSLLAFAFFYWTAFKPLNKTIMGRGISFLGHFIIFLSLSMGMSLHNSVAVLEGLAGKKSSFIRTPKFNVVSNSDKWTQNKYLKKNFNLIIIFEGLLSIYFLAGIIGAVFYKEYGFLPLYLMLFFGFGSVFVHSVKS